MRVRGRSALRLCFAGGRMRRTPTITTSLPAEIKKEGRKQGEQTAWNKTGRQDAAHAHNHHVLACSK